MALSESEEDTSHGQIWVSHHFTDFCRFVSFKSQHVLGKLITFSPTVHRCHTWPTSGTSADRPLVLKT